MLFLQAALVERPPERMLERPADLYKAEGRVFWTAMAVELAAIREGEPRPTIKDIQRATGQRRGSGG